MLSILSSFIPTFFVVSITPGMCMTLALSLGMTIGLKKTLWMMLGELVGVALVATSSVMGVATVMVEYPDAFFVLKIVGGLYLFYLGIALWRSKGRMAMGETQDAHISEPRALILQGFTTAIANPKGWAFFVALLPPFLSADIPLQFQLPVLICVILLLEFICLTIYASGGKSLGKLLQNTTNVKCINRIAGILMAGIGVWLIATPGLDS